MTSSNTINLAGKIAIITGGARGLGLAIAEQMALAGAKVALVDVKADLVNTAAKALESKGYAAMPVVADVSDGASVRAAVETVVNAWGRVDILVNNAGICPLTSPEAITEAEWDRVLAVNLKGTFLFSQAVMPVMRRQHSGKIINMTSSAAQTGGLIAGLHYSASKGGIISLTRSLARLLAPEIQVNAVSPGMIDTPMTDGWSDDVKDNALRQMPLHRMGQPADVAWAVLYLASEASDFIVGHTLAVSGGLYMG
jgi:NAD(P)-dependent dehydrogenase (short-subunit alcohol dehydrogenase family)